MGVQQRKLTTYRRLAQRYPQPTEKAVTVVVGNDKAGKRTW